MSYDNWKTSPPCPTCGAPNCICSKTDAPPAGPGTTFWILLSSDKSTAVLTSDEAERDDLLSFGCTIASTGLFYDNDGYAAKDIARDWFTTWSRANLPC